MNIKEYQKYYQKHGHSPPRKCKKCGVDVDKGKSFCMDCKSPKSDWCGRRKYKICGYEGCKELRTYRKHSCEYHSKENRLKREYKMYLEEIVSCRDCGGELGKRKELTYGEKIRRLCNDCCEKKRVIRRKYQTEYYMNRYQNDEEYRNRFRVYQKNYREKRKIEVKEK